MKRFIFIINFLFAQYVFAQVENVRVYNSSNTLIHTEKITSMSIDQEKNVWIGTLEGLIIYNGINWNLLTTKNSDLPSNKILCITHQNTTTYIGTAEGMIEIKRYSRHVVGYFGKVYNTTNSNLPSNKIREIIVDKNGCKWLATSNGLVRYNGKFETMLNKKINGIKDDNFISLTIDNEDKIWAGTNNGLYSFQGNIWRVYNKNNSSIPDNHIWDIVVDSENKKWIATKNGIATIQENEWEIFNKKNTPLETNVIKIIKFDDYDRLWVGTDKGMVTFDGVEGKKNIICKKKKDIYSVFIDEKDNKWIGTKESLIVYNQDGIDSIHNKRSITDVIVSK